jgi:hypothetical protein
MDREQVERPVEQFVNQLQRTCEEQECKLVVPVLQQVAVLAGVGGGAGRHLGRRDGRQVGDTGRLRDRRCGARAVAFIVELILSIPIIGGFIRMVLNWVTEIVWRLVGLVDFVASLAGIRPRKKMYFGVIVPPLSPIATDADIMRQVDAVIAFYDGPATSR